MLTLENLLVFIPTIVILVILPGPDFAIVTKISLFDGKKPAQAAAAGITLGMCIHTTLAMLGLSAIVASSAVLFSAIKYVGAVYLFYVGITELSKSLKVKKIPSQHETEEGVIKRTGIEHHLTHYFYAGFLTNVLNPKAILYFMVLFPQFINPHAPLPTQFLEMGMIGAAATLIWYMLVASIFTRIRAFFASSSCQRWLMRFMGIIFITFGLKLAFQRLD